MIDENFLYHATLDRNLKSILRFGLLPSKSESSLNAIYLTNDLFTAENYSSMRPDNDFVILKIDISKLDQNFFVPDNYELIDFLEDLEDEDHPFYEKNINDCTAKDSLELCNQVAYTKNIPVDAITVFKELKSERCLSL